MDKEERIQFPGGAAAKGGGPKIARC